MNIDFENFKAKVMIKHLELDKYIYIMEKAKEKVNDVEFKKVFNSFYDIRRDTEEWQPDFYEVFQLALENKEKEEKDFGNLLERISKIGGTVEISYTTKLLATLNPKLPVWDRNVAKNIKKYYDKTHKEIYNLDKYIDNQYAIRGNGFDNKIKNAKELYSKLIKIESEMLNDSKIKKAIRRFKEYYESNLKNILKNEENYPYVKDFKFEDEKILDFFLWKL